MTVATVAPQSDLPSVTNPLAKTLHQQKVEKFMRLAGQDCPDSPTMPPADVRVLRAKLIMEEAFELIENGLGINVKVSGPAFGTSEPFLIRNSSLSFDPRREPNMIELADGMADLSFVNIGTAVSAGIAMAHIQDLVDENNLAKFGPGSYVSDGTDGNPKGKLVKPPGHQPPDIAGALNLQVPPDVD